MSRARLPSYLVFLVMAAACHERTNPRTDAGGTGDDAPRPGDGDITMPECTASGSLDPAFGDDGVVRLFGPQQGMLSAAGGAAALDSSGRIVVVGERVDLAASPGDPQFRNCVIARLLPTGVPDPSFGGGIVFTSVNGAACRYQAVTFQSDGKIVVAGKINQYTEPRAIIARYLDNGVLDQTFGDHGFVITPQESAVTAVVVDDAGRISFVGVLASEDDATTSWYVGRYVSDGSSDASFANGSGASAPFGNTGANVAYSAALDSNGALVGVGSVASTLDDPPRFAVARFDSAGVPDDTFAGSGELLLLPGTSAIASDVTIDSSDRIMVVGERDNTDSTDTDGVILRLTATGALDPAFGAGGVVFERRAFPLLFAAIDSDAAGNLLAAGYEQTAPNGSQLLLVRYTEQGVRDITFGADGFADELALPGTQQVPAALIVQPDRRAVVAGGIYSLAQNWSDIFVARYCP